MLNPNSPQAGVNFGFADCEHDCTNYNFRADGKTHECSCDDGYALDADGRSCNGKYDNLV